MGDAQAPGGYFVGRPANFEDKQPDAVPDVQNRESAPVAVPENLGQQQGEQAPVSGGQKKPSFLGGLFSCFSGGRAES